jgi:threonine synthase
VADRIVLRAVRETQGACVAVSDDEMAVAAANMAALEGISASLEGAATLAGLRRLHDEGVIRPEDRVVLVNTGVGRGAADGALGSVPLVRTADEAMAQLGLAPRAS